VEAEVGEDAEPQNLIGNRDESADSEDEEQDDDTAR